MTRNALVFLLCAGALHAQVLTSDLTVRGKLDSASLLRVTRTSSTVLTLADDAATTAPASVLGGNTVYTFTAPATATISAGSGLAYLYVTAAGGLTVGHNGLTIVCAGGCTVVSSITAFPLDSTPLYTWNATSGTWDAAGGTDKRAFLGSRRVTSGLGIIVTDSGSGSEVAADTSVTPRKFSGSGAPGSVSGSTRGDLYTDTANGDEYVCNNAGPCTTVASGNWVKVTGGTGTYDPMDITADYFISYPGQHHSTFFPEEWRNNSSGAESYQATAASGQDHRMYGLSPPATANSWTWLTFGKQPSNQTVFGDFVQASAFRAFHFKIRGKINATTSAVFAVGLCDNNTDFPSNCLMIQNDTAVDTNWRCIVRVAASNTATTNIVATNTSAHTFEVYATAAGTLNCKVDATSVTAVATFPTATSWYFGVFTKTLDASTKFFAFDNFRGKITGWTR